MRFRPCIDLHEGKVKQIVGSTLTDSGNGLVTNFVTEHPASFYAGLYRKDNLTGGHVIMLGPGNEAAASDALCAYPDGLQVGGGINTDNAQLFLDAGASHVIVTSFVFTDGCIVWERLSSLSQRIGRSRLVVDLSCKKRDGQYFIVTDRWQKFTTVAIQPDVLDTLAGYCDEFLVHAVDIEGKQGGVDGELIALLAKISPIAVTYAGGVRTLADLETVRTHGSGRVDATVGSALDIFGGTLKYTDVVAWDIKERVR